MSHRTHGDCSPVYRASPFGHKSSSIDSALQDFLLLVVDRSTLYAFPPTCPPSYLRNSQHIVRHIQVAGGRPHAALEKRLKGPRETFQESVTVMRCFSKVYRRKEPDEL